MNYPHGENDKSLFAPFLKNKRCCCSSSSSSAQDLAVLCEWRYLLVGCFIVAVEAGSVRSLEQQVHCATSCCITSKGLLTEKSSRLKI